MKKSFNEEQIREFIFHFFSEKIFSVTFFLVTYNRGRKENQQ